MVTYNLPLAWIADIRAELESESTVSRVSVLMEEVAKLAEAVGDLAEYTERLADRVQRLEDQW